jgi:hypothetical protein
MNKLIAKIAAFNAASMCSARVSASSIDSMPVAHIAAPRRLLLQPINLQAQTLRDLLRLFQLTFQML